MNGNKIRQRLALVAAGAALIGTIAIAPKAFTQAQAAKPQQRGGQQFDPAQRTERRVTKMTETLKLNPAQVTRIRAILTDERTQMEALRKNASNQQPNDRAGTPAEGGRGGDQPDGGRGGRGGRGGHREMSPEMKAIHDKTEKQIESVLTAQQLSTFRTQQQERAKHDSTERQGRFNS